MDHIWTRPVKSPTKRRLDQACYYQEYSNEGQVTFEPNILEREGNESI